MCARGKVGEGRGGRPVRDYANPVLIKAMFAAIIGTADIQTLGNVSITHVLS